MRRNVALLLQGQMVSSLGDALYRLALGFWILEETGSTGLTGIVMALTVLPKAVASPLAGAAADRLNRKWIIVLSDLFCGGVALLIGLAALTGQLCTWMFPAAAFLLGLGSAFFGPALESALPDLVEKDQLSRLNAAFSFSTTGAAILGNALGGFLFGLLGAPLLFLINGASFVLSAISESFVRLPRPIAAGGDSLVGDLRVGLASIAGAEGLGLLMITAGVANFLLGGAFVLIMAHCDSTPDLGPTAYGLMMGALGGGALLGYLAAVYFKISGRARCLLYLASGLARGILLAVVSAADGLALKMVLFAGIGLCISIDSVTLTTSIQIRAPEKNRGKILGLRAAIMTVMSPLGMLAAGTAAEAMEPARLIFVTGLAIVGLFVISGLIPSVRYSLTDK